MGQVDLAACDAGPGAGRSLNTSPRWASSSGRCLYHCHESWLGATTLASLDEIHVWPCLRVCCDSREVQPNPVTTLLPSLNAPVTPRHTWQGFPVLSHGPHLRALGAPLALSPPHISPGSSCFTESSGGPDSTAGPLTPHEYSHLKALTLALPSSQYPMLVALQCFLRVSAQTLRTGETVPGHHVCGGIQPSSPPLSLLVLLSSSFFRHLSPCPRRKTSEVRPPPGQAW